MIECEPAKDENILLALFRLAPQEREMIESAVAQLRPEWRFPDWPVWAFCSRDDLGKVIDAPLEAEERGLFLTVGAARDLACKLTSLRDDLTL